MNAPLENYLLILPFDKIAHFRGPGQNQLSDLPLSFLLDLLVNNIIPAQEGNCFKFVLLKFVKVPFGKPAFALTADEKKKVEHARIVDLRWMQVDDHVLRILIKSEKCMHACAAWANVSLPPIYIMMNQRHNRTSTAWRMRLARAKPCSASRCGDVVADSGGRSSRGGRGGTVEPVKPR
jgi:hypothetical protein